MTIAGHTNLTMRRDPRASRERGFTLLELMMTLAVAAILSGTAAPALGTFLKNSGLKGAAYELMGTMTIARSEAVKRGSRTILCHSADPHNGTPACGGSAQDWSTGWLVFIDENGNTNFDVGTDILLTVGDARADGIELRSNTAADSTLIFRADGSLEGASIARFVLCDNRGAVNGKQVNVTRVGRPGLVSGSTASPLTSCSPS